MRGKGWIFIWALIPFGMIMSQPAWGEEYPSKPIEIMCAFGAGSSTDLMCRLVAETAKKYLGQPVVVVNKTGAGGSAAAAEVISSKPDGYKLFSSIINSYFAITANTQKLPFNPNSLIPLVSFLQLKDGLCVKGDSPWKTLNDLIEHARKNPGKVRWAHSGRGLGAHINILLIFKKAGVQTVDVPYKGASEKLSALLGGHVAASTMPLGPVKDLVEAGKVRYLVVESDQRYSDLPNVPSAAELGFPEAGRLTPHVGFCVHKDTPEEIKRTLFAAFKKSYEDPTLRDGLEKLGDEPRFGDAEFLRQAIKRSEEVGIPVLKELGLYVGK